MDDPTASLKRIRAAGVDPDAETAKTSPSTPSAERGSNSGDGSARLLSALLLLVMEVVELRLPGDDLPQLRPEQADLAAVRVCLHWPAQVVRSPAVPRRNWQP